MKTKAMLKKIVAAGCAAVMLMTLPGVYVYADGQQEDYELGEEFFVESGTPAESSEAPGLSETAESNDDIELETVISDIEEAVDVGAGDDYPANLKNAARDSIVDPWNFYNRECTSFVAWCLNSRNGVHFTNQYLGASRWGNANTWGTVASNLGVRVDKTPAVGAVAWWNTGTYGHVAWVSSINGGNVFIEEYNYNSNGNYHTRTIASSNPTGYIHIADINIVPEVSFTPWSNDNYTYIRDTDASIGMKITVSGGTCTSTGMYLYDSDGAYLAKGANGSYTYAQVFFQINAEMGYTLSPGTIYKYKFYAIVNGQTYWSDEGSFITIGRVMTSGYSRVLPDGDYRIVSAANVDYYLDIVGSEVPAAGGTNVALCGAASGHLPAYEIWNLTYSDGFYIIRQKGTDMCLDVANADTAASANIQMCQSNGSNAQKWAISQFGDIGYRVQAKCSGLSLDIYGASISAGTNIQQYPNNNSNAQRWLFIPYEPVKTIADGRYILVSALNSNLVLDISGDTASVSDGTNVQVWNDSASAKYNAIDVNYLDNGYYRLKQAASGKSIVVQDSSVANNANIVIDTQHDYRREKWAIIKQGSGYMIVSQLSGYAFDVYNGSTANGTNVQQHYYNGSNAQTWKFVQAEYKVSYNANGGTGAPSSQTKYYRNDLTLSSTKPTRSGYTFKGWATSQTASSAEYQAGGNFTQDKNITLYAVWAVQTKQISTCIVTLSPASYTYDGTAKKPSVTVKDGSTTLVSGTDYTLSYANNTNAGTATVTVTGKGSYTGTVRKDFTISQAAPTLKFAKSSLTKTVDDAAFTNKLTATTDGTVTYKSSDTAVAAVNKTNGKVTIKGAGKATITATAAAGTNYKAGSAKYTLTVTEGGAIKSISLSETSITIVYGHERAVPIVTYSPENTTDEKTVEWTSSNENLVTVSGGRIRAIDPGKAVITAKVPGRNVSASANVRILFSDVTDTGLWYYEPVYWALDNNITSGYGKGTFQPTAGLTRAQTVSFLYKMAGSPDVSRLVIQEFTDVKKGDWYYDAVKWAAANKITSGYGEGTFRPNATCTRAMIVSFLMSYSKLVGTYMVPASSANFSDVPPGAWYKTAVDWAVENGITKGYGKGTFSPDVTCTRAMMVTFLKKAAELPKVY